MNKLSEDVLLDFHGTLRTEFLAAEAFDTFASVYLRNADVFAAIRNHGYSFCRAGFVAFFAADTLGFLDIGPCTEGEL